MAFLPLQGDVVIHKLPGTVIAYGTSVYPGVDQYCQNTFATARSYASIFGRLNLVDVWYTEDDKQFSSVNRFRTSHFS